MKMKIVLALAAGVAAVTGVALLMAVVKAVQPVAACTDVMVLAVGSCDSEGTCGAVVITQQGEIGKVKMSYPIAGYPECIP